MKNFLSREKPYLELCSEPELNDLIAIDLTPDVQDAQDHWIHQELKDKQIQVSFTVIQQIPRQASQSGNLES